MTDPEDDFPPPAPRSRFRRLRKVSLWLLGGCAVLVLLAVVSRWQIGRLGQRKLDATTQKLDADDPGWRLDAVIDAHNKNAPPAKENAAPQVVELSERIPQAFRDWQKSEDAATWHTRKHANTLPRERAIVAARTVAVPTLFVRTDALRLRDGRAGAFPLDIASAPLALRLPHLDNARQVAALLQFDGMLAALDRNPNRGISAARAALGVARSIGEEPLFVSQLVRMACAKVGAQTATQVLAWGEPTDGLAELQAELLAEADVPWFRYGMRGERAYLDRVFAGLEDGSITPETFFRLAGVGEPGPQHYAAFRTYKALLPGDRAKCLQLCTEYVEASKLPAHEQYAAVNRVPFVQAESKLSQYPLTGILMPALGNLAAAGLRTRAELLAAATCVACERFRRKERRWPRDLAELVPAYLGAVPLSPFDGGSVRFRALGDRVSVYSFWADCPLEQDSPPSDFRHDDTPGKGYGYRVWNTDCRGLPAEEKKQP